MFKKSFHKGKAKQKFYYKGEHHENDYEVDIVPFGEIADGEIIAWPPDGTPEMSVKCFTDVMEHAIPVKINEEFSVFANRGECSVSSRRCGIPAAQMTFGRNAEPPIVNNEIACLL